MRKGVATRLPDSRPLGVGGHFDGLLACFARTFSVARVARELRVLGELRSGKLLDTKRGAAYSACQCGLGGGQLGLFDVRWLRLAFSFRSAVRNE